MKLCKLNSRVRCVKRVLQTSASRQALRRRSLSIFKIHLLFNNETYGDIQTNTSNRKIEKCNWNTNARPCLQRDRFENWNKKKKDTTHWALPSTRFFSKLKNEKSTVDSRGIYARWNK